MKVSKNSLHYTVNSIVFENPKGNLCGYFWQTVLAFILIGPLYVITFPTVFMLDKDEEESPSFSYRIILGIIAYTALYLIISMMLVFFIHTDSVRIPAFFGYLILVVVILVVLSEKGYFKRKNIEKKPKKESIVISYIKAKKAKMCPIIEFTED